MLKELKATHELIIHHYNKKLSSPSLTEGEVYDLSNELQGAHYESQYDLVPRLMTAITQVADLLNDHSLLNDITADEYDATAYERYIRQIEYANMYHGAETMTQSIPKIQDKIKEIQGFIDRLEKEMPTKAL